MGKKDVGKFMHRVKGNQVKNQALSTFTVMILPGPVIAWEIPTKVSGVTTAEEYLGAINALGGAICEMTFKMIKMKDILGKDKSLIEIPPPGMVVK